MTESSEGRLQEYFSRRIPNQAFPILDSIARRAVNDANFRNALGIFRTLKTLEIDAISYDAMMLEESVMPEAVRSSVNKKRRIAKAKFSLASEGAEEMMRLLHPEAPEHLQTIESAFSEAYELGSMDIQEMHLKVELMKDIVAALGIYVWKI